MQQQPTMPKQLQEGMKYISPEWQDYKGGNLDFAPAQYTQTPDYQKSLSKIGEMVNAPQGPNAYMDQAQKTFTNIMDPNYKAYSDADINREFDAGSKKLQEGFDRQRKTLSAQLAANGLTGSGTAGSQWSQFDKNTTDALTDYFNGLQSENRQATRQDKTNALQMTPQMASLANEFAIQPLRNQQAWASILGNENQNVNQFNQWNTGQKNQAALYNWQRPYETWRQKIDFNQNVAAGQNQVNQANFDLAYKKYLQDLENAQRNSPLGILGTLFGNFT